MKRKENTESNKNLIQPIVAYFNSRERYYYNIRFNEFIRSFENGELLKLNYILMISSLILHSLKCSCI